jgi:hypothetical protein
MFLVVQRDQHLCVACDCELESIVRVCLWCCGVVVLWDCVVNVVTVDIVDVVGYLWFLACGIEREVSHFAEAVLEEGFRFC